MLVFVTNYKLYMEGFPCATKETMYLQLLDGVVYDCLLWDLWSRVPFSSDMSLLASSGFATYADSRRLSTLLCCVGVCVPLPSSLSVFILQH